MNLSRRICGKTTWVLLRGLSTEVDTASPASAAGQRDDHRLYRRLSSLGANKRMVAKTINEYLREGKVPRKFELDRCIAELRKYGRYHHALEIMEWMEMRCTNFKQRDFAIRLDLIAKVKGIEEAEKYFNCLSPQNKNFSTYGALLNCYCTEKMEDKASTLFKEMEEMNIVSSLSFNNLMSLYMRLGQPEKVACLVEEMKKRNIKPSTFTYNVWMNSLMHLDDIEGAERVFEEVKRENPKECDWTTYSNLAVIYTKFGLHDKAELALKKLEEVMRPQNREAYHFLITLYAGISNLSEVHRIWNSLKSKFKVVTNMSYLIMLQSLGKLNDTKGLKECYEEWESRCSSYDSRLAKLVIGYYLRHDLLQEALSVFDRARERSHGSFLKIFETFMSFHLKKNQAEEALQWAASCSEESREWCPESAIVDEFFKHFKKEGNIDGAEYFCKLLKKVESLDYNGYKALLETYISAGKTEPGMRERIEKEGILVSSDLEYLLQRVSPE